MFSDNQTISYRQVYRLYVFSLVGISTLILPGRLAEKNGVYGTISILAGGALAFCYLFYLKWAAERMQTDIVTYLSKGQQEVAWAVRIVFSCLAFSAVMTAGYVAGVFAKLVQKSLTVQEDYLLILALLILVGGYALMGGIKSRARVCEVLFWFVFIPMFVLLFLSLREISGIYFEFDKSPDIGKMLCDIYLCFWPFQILFFALFLPKYTSQDNGRLFFSIRLALACAVGILLAFYLVLVGTFGANALATMDFPAVTFLSNVQFSGGFLKRLDAIMMGIWFFTLFALLNMNMHYAFVLLQNGVQKNGKKRYLLCVLSAVFLLGTAFEYVEQMQQIFLCFFLFLSVPVYVLLPGIILIAERRKL